MRIGVHAAAAVFTALALASAPARAEAIDDEIAKARFATGVAYYDLKRFVEAVREFTEAYHLSHRPVILFNIARSYEHMGDAGRATTQYRRYLTLRPDAPERSEVETKLSQLAPVVGTLVIRTLEPDATVKLDGEQVGTSPVDPQLVTEGKHRVEVRDSRGGIWTREVTVSGGRTVDVLVDGRPRPAETEPKEAAPPAIPDETLARAHFDAGRLYFDATRYEPAAREFLAGFRNSGKADLLYNAARSFERMGDAGRAVRHYRGYLAADPQSPGKTEVEAKLRALGRRTGTLTVQSTLPGSEVLVDGEVVGQAPIESLPVSAGPHEVEVHNPGYAAATATVRLAAGETEVVELDPRAAAQASVKLKGRWWDLPEHRRLTWWLVGVGSVLVVAAVVTTVLVLTLGGN